MYRIVRNLLSFNLLLIMLSTCAYAEQSDRDKPMHMEADQVVIDDAQRISTFSGNVQITQGTRLLRGDKIVVTQDKQGLQKGVITGNPASFRQKREGLDEYVEGYAERIEYDARAETINFFGKAKIKRNLDEIRGEHISYSAKTEVFQVNSGSSPGADGQPNRVRGVFQPKSQKNNTAGESVKIKSSTQLSPQE